MDHFRTDSDDDDSVMGTEHEPEVVTAILYLKEYASTKGHSVHSISQMPPEQLADYLKDFYTTVKFKGIEVKDLASSPIVSLKYLRTGLHRYFQRNYDIDILKDVYFEHANKVFDVTSRATPRRSNKLRIEFDDLRKIYMGPGMNLDQPDTLQNKLFFDVNLYICNRGKDFLRVMAKDDFVISSDADGRRYVWLKYHPKFSFRELVGGVADPDLSNNGTQIGDRMFERKGDPRCPVTSFLAYLSHLHPMTEAFWQRPKRSFVYADYVWYDNTPLGNSTLSKIMTRVCQSAGLFENYTNHAIKSSYIPVIQNLCKMDGKKGCLHPEVTEPRSTASPLATCSQGIRDVDDGMTDSGSVCSDVKDTEPDDHTIGLQQAKMKVLEMVHGLGVKDIRSFVDWMKTFRAEKDGGGLVVLCSPVDQTVQETNSRTGSSLTKGSNSFKLSNGSGSRSGSPAGTPPVHRQREPSPAPLSTPRLDVCRTPKDGKPEGAAAVSDLGIAIRQLDFDSIGDTYVSTSEIYPVKVTIPCGDTVLLNGLRDSDQILIHNREGAPPMSESVHSRIFYSQHEMDVAVVTALLSTRNSLKKSGHRSSSGCEKSENCSKIEDKYKPMKKRSLSDLHADCSKEDFEFQPNKRQLISSSLTTANLPVSRVSATTSYPPVISNVPVLSYISRGIGIPQTQRETRQMSLLANKITPTNNFRIKTEPVDK
ncbi:uncharacterized protein LOC110452971 [Mizuhopecten yessoensis]|uniref:uncharacterized protein LOC110452971 n=1 Tax=Mizuhopecten yessoensis TaxID=6573 RepID=UPI000B4576B7|nr:uncharacterized protein LOC110452971 [Mizuhopecten yessoensis]